MAKLIVELSNLVFQTTALRAHNKETFEIDILTGAAAENILNGIPPEDLQFELVSTNEEIEASFPFQLKTAKKGSTLEVKMRGDGLGLEATINGKFETTLRSGVAPLLQALGTKLDLRLRGICHKGGEYSGFLAPVVGGDYDQESGANWKNTFPQISTYSIK